MELCGAALLALILGAAPGEAAPTQEPSPPPSPAAEPSERPRVRHIEVTGVTVYEVERLPRILRVAEGDELWRSPSDLARALETRYRLDGYLAARVQAEYDAVTSTLRLTVDEGRLLGVEIQGLAGAPAERARREMGLQPGMLLREQDVLEALRRVHEASDATIESSVETPYSVQWTPEGARLVVPLEAHPLRPALRFPGPGVASIYNRVEGFFPGAGLELLLASLGSYNHARLNVGGSYGFESEHFRYALGAQKPLGAERPLVLGYEYHDLTDTDDSYRASSLAESQGRTIFFWSQQDYFRRTGHEGFAFWRPARSAQLGLSFRDDDYESLPSVTDDSLLFIKRDSPPNPAVEEGRMRSAIATLRWTSGGPLFDKRQIERSSYLLRSLYGTFPGQAEALRLEATFEYSAPDLLDSAFDFTRFIATVHTHHSPISARPLYTRAIVGLTGRHPPVQKLFAIGGVGTLRGYDRKEFVGENMLLASLEWQLVADHFPLPAFYLIYDGGKVWTKGQPGQGWKNVAGVGLEFALQGRAFLRVDTVVLLEEPGARGRFSTSFRVKAPF